MQFKWHFLIGLISSALISYLFNLSSFAMIIIFVSSWLIDADHYFWYLITRRDLNPFNALGWYFKSLKIREGLSKKQKSEFKKGIFIFHSIIFWIILFLLSFLNLFFAWVLIGVGIHMILDFVDLYFKEEPLYQKIFVFYTMRRNKNKKELFCS